MPRLEVKGFAWLNLLRFVQETHGEAALAQLQAELPEYAAHFNQAAVLPIGWVPGAMHLEAMARVVARHYGGTSGGARTFGFALATRNVSSTFSSFSRLEDLRVALMSTGRAFSTFYSQGQMKLTLEGERLDAHLTGFPEANALFGDVLGAGMLAFLHAGRVEGKLEHVTTTADSIRYAVTLHAVPQSLPTPTPFTRPD